MEQIVSMRLYRKAYVAWLAADRKWQLALADAARLVPDARTRLSWRIGAPRSPVRNAWEARSHALERLEVARLEHREALLRLRRLERRPHTPPRLLVYRVL